MIAPGTLGWRRLDDLLALDPAALLGRSDDRAHIRDRDLEQLLLGAPPIFVSRCGRGRRHRQVRILVAADLPHRRDAVVHVVLPERRVVARLQHDAAAAKARILADLPATALDDGRRRAIVETERRKIRRRLADHERASAKALGVVKGDLRGSLSCDHRRRRAQKCPECRSHVRSRRCTAGWPPPRYAEIITHEPPTRLSPDRGEIRIMSRPRSLPPIESR